MSEFNNQATKTATYTQDISYAELDGANRGQRPDLLAREQGIYRTPDGKLYSVQGTQLLAADNLVPTLKTDPLTGGVTWMTGPDGKPVYLTNNAPVQRPWRMTVFGDSRAVFLNTNTQLAVTGSTTGLNDSRVATWLAGYLGDCELVASYGVSGDTAVLWASTSRANSKTINNLIAANLFKGGPVDAVYVQYGINDFIAGTSAAVVAAAIQACLSALMGAGYKIIYESTNPVTAANYGAGPAAKLQATIDCNTAMKAWLSGYPNQAAFVDTFASLIDGTGYASTTYYADGTHFNRLGAMQSGQTCAIAARYLFPRKVGQTCTSGSLLQPNLIDWSGPTLFAVNDQGTVTFNTPTWNVDAVTGLPYAEVTATCTVLASGRAMGHLEVHATTIAGATPRYPLSIGDEVQASGYLVIDDGAGGIPPIQSALFRHRAYFDGKFADSGAFIGAAGPNFTSKVNHRLTPPTFVLATGSGAIAAAAAGVGYPIQAHVEFNTVGQSARIRIYAPAIRVVSQAQPSSPAYPGTGVAYVNTSGTPGTLYIGGGTITAITIARQGSQFTTGQTFGAFRLAQNDSVTCTSSVNPTSFVFVPDEQKAA